MSWLQFWPIPVGAALGVLAGIGIRLMRMAVSDDRSAIDEVVAEVRAQMAVDRSEDR